MTTRDEAIKAVSGAFATKQNAVEWQTAMLGDGKGTVSTGDNTVYCRLTANSSVVEVLNYRVAPVDGLLVRIAKTPEMPLHWQVIGQADQRADEGSSTTTGGIIYNTPPHQKTHAYLGVDQVNVDWRQITTLRVYAYSGFTIGVLAGLLPRPGADLVVPTQTLDLSASVPTSGGARFTLISVNSAGALVATDGTVATGILTLTLGDIPDTPAGNFRLAAVRLYAGQAAISESTTSNDIRDLRWPQERLATSISPADITLTDTHVIVGNASGVGADVAMSGDATIANTGALTFATVNSNVGSFTYASLTVNAKGLVTAASSGTAPTTGTGTAGRVTQWSTTTTLGDSNIIGSGAGLLTLSAAGTYTLAVPATGVALLGDYANAGYIETLAALKIPTTSSLAVGTLQQNGARLLHTYGTNNLFVGPSAGNFTLTTATAVDNTALGDAVLAALTSGARNFGAGRLALSKLQSGSNNFALGALAMENALTTANDTAIGYYAMHDGTSTQNNIGIGVSALEKNNAAADGRNVAIGNASLQLNTAGVRNVAIGDSVANGMTGSYNTVLGAFAGVTGNNGSRNIYIGYQAGYRQTSLSDLLIIDNQAQAAAADNIDKSIIYGVMSSTPGNQTLNVNALLTARIMSATTSAPVEVQRIEARTTGTAAAGFGGAIALNLESASTADQVGGRIEWLWNVATHASAVSDVVLSAAYNSGAAIVAKEFLRGRGNAGIIVTGSQTGTYTATAVDLTLSAIHHFVVVTAASKTITLPAAAGCTGREYIIKTTAASTTIDGNGAELIDGGATLVIYQYEAAQIISDGTGWHIV
ncbi:MAG: hypothetical protein IPO08_20445 [Xanthomonadales bacterium]|nr:hypothetical protein [Xanthomonadales bacterium]